MIKKQYRWGQPSYFINFYTEEGCDDIVEKLKPYNATLGKSKNKNYYINVKWHSDRDYMMFVLRWS